MTSYDQVAGLHAIQQGLIAFDDPVSKYLPQFATENLLIFVPGKDGEDPTYVPARHTMTLRHLFNFTSGLIYRMIGHPDGPVPFPQYSTEYDQVDPIGQFIDLIKVITFFVLLDEPVE